VERLGDGGDEPWGLVALALAVALTPKTVWAAKLTQAGAWAAGTLVLASAAGTASLPMLVRAGLWVGALGVVLGKGGGGRAWGRGALLGLSLPVTTTLQFYAGYPLRVLAAELSRGLLAPVGVSAERVGVVLRWAGGEVVVDAPCSGVQMLWTATVVGAVFVTRARLSAGRAILFGGLTAAVAIGANALRATLLFFFESGLWPSVKGGHEAIGLGVFALAVGVLGAVASKFSVRAPDLG